MISARATTLLALGLTLLLNAKAAQAVQITCTPPDGSEATSYDTDLNRFSYPNAAGQPIPLGLHLVSSTDNTTLSIQDSATNTLATFEVLGHALNSTVNLITPAGKIPCVTTGDVEPLFENLITDLKTTLAIKRWKTWAAARPTPCDPFFDSIGYFQPNSNGKIALVIHGYSSNPRRMQPVIRVLLDAGYNVIAPRLSNHFDMQIKDLDNASADAWIKDAEDTFAIATRFSPSVTLVGYSLGGALVSRLALEHSDYVNRLVLVAPAWRVTQGVSWGSLIGGAFSISYNDFMKIPVACTASAGYTSSVAGQQVEKVAFATDMKFDNGNIEPIPMEYARLRIPFIVFTTPDDNTISTAVVDPICRNDAMFCTQVTVPGRQHTNFTEDMTVMAGAPFAKASLGDMITTYLQAKFSADPRYPAVLDPSDLPSRPSPEQNPHDMTSLLK